MPVPSGARLSIAQPPTSNDDVTVDEAAGVSIVTTLSPPTVMSA